MSRHTDCAIKCYNEIETGRLAPKFGEEESKVEHGDKTLKGQEQEARALKMVDLAQYQPGSVVCQIIVVK